MPSFPDLNIPARISLGPGPSTSHPRVLRAMATPVVSYQDPNFLAVCDRVQDLLRYLFQTQNPLTIPISGTGTAAMETAVANMVEPGDSVLVCVQGYFGQRIADMARLYGGDVEIITRPWGEVFSPDDVKTALARRPAKVVAIVHGETSTGVEQPIAAIAAIVRAQGGILIVDTVASLGGTPVKVDDWQVDVCYSGSQKCLSCSPGLGPITFGPRAVEKLEQRTTRVANWYLDMTMIRRYWSEERLYHHTTPVSMIYALYEGLRVIAEEGLDACWARHQRNAELLWEGLEALGMSLFVPKENRLASLTTVRIPDGVDDLAVRRALLNDYSIEIVGGLGELKGIVWRIGLMGYSSQQANVVLLLAALEKLLKN
jgi:alanine-glyoxylate transaminase/serine-glyoxylate transaminase/serine-pyruvate transaminase